MKLIVGLGNPGSQYAQNRHSMGFQCLNYLAKAHGLSYTVKAGKARLATGRINGHEVALAKPQTFMNLSGESVASLMARFRLRPADILVVHDDVDLPLGRLRLRPGGGSGGHRGLESIIRAVGSQDFIRLRVGVGRPPDTGEGELSDYVLSDFSPDDRETLHEVFQRVAEAILVILNDGIAAAMNRYNA